MSYVTFETRGSTVFELAGALFRTAARYIGRMVELAVALAVILLTVATLPGQDVQNVVTVEVTESGFIFDGLSICDATFESLRGAPIVVESFSIPGHAGALSPYNVDGLTGEDLKISSLEHEIKVVHTAGQTFIDVWLFRAGSSPNLTSSRYWMSPKVPSINASTATKLRDNGDLDFASTAFRTEQIAIRRMDRAPVVTGETSPTGAAITSYKGKLVVASTYSKIDTRDTSDFAPVVTDSHGAPVNLREVTLKDSQDNFRLTFTNSKVHSIFITSLWEPLNFHRGACSCLSVLHPQVTITRSTSNLIS
jgi:hypothetical protein